jgi:hypothetical protein
LIDWRQILSWQVETNEFYELERLLNNKHYSYHLEGNTFIIDHEGYVYLPFLTSLPNNVQFNNRGYVYLYYLTSLPNNIQFNNRGDVDLNSLTSLPDNIQFNNRGNVYLNSLTSLPNNVQFNNRGYVNLASLLSLPNNKYDIFKNDGVISYNHRNSQFNPKDREKLSWKEVEWSDLKGWLVKDTTGGRPYWAEEDYKGEVYYLVISVSELPNKNLDKFNMIALQGSSQDGVINEYEQGAKFTEPYWVYKDLRNIIPIRKIF